MNYVLTAVLFALVQSSIAQDAIKTRAVQDFRLDITKAAIEAAPGRNIYLSPNTVLKTIVAACKVSHGNTKKEIEKAVGSCSAAEKFLSGQLSDLELYHNNATFFVDPKINPKDGNQYESINFADGNSVNKVNQWISNVTGKHIPNFYEGSFEPTIGALPVSADSFESFWKYPFAQEATKKGQFQNGKDTIDVDYMSNDKIILFYSTKKLQSIGIPYERDGVHMYIILPHENDTATNLSEKLTRDDYEDIFQNSQQTQVHYEVPKLDFKITENLRNALNILGVVRSFMPGVANFSGLTESKINMDNIRYKSVVNMFESGTNAAGATAMEMVTSAEPRTVSPIIKLARYFGINASGFGGGIPTPQTFVANRPFLFVTYDKNTLSWLTSGVVYNPHRSNKIN